MPSPQYLVTAAPGIRVPGVGFCYPGEVFDAPPGFQPSRTLRAMNQEAVTALEDVLSARANQLQERLAERPGIADRARLTADLDALQALRAKAMVIVTPEELGDLRSVLPHQRTRLQEAD